jgi:hypothetical protein
MKLDKQKVRLYIASVIAIMFSFVLYCLIYINIPENNADVLKVTLGFLGGAFVTMVTFYFGDSAGKDNV